MFIMISSATWILSRIYPGFEIVKQAGLTSVEKPLLLRDGATQTCLHTFGQSSLEVYYDAIGGNVHYTATVASGQYVAMGYGTDMSGTDMVAWIDDGSANAQQDLYSSGEQSPSILASSENTYTTVVASTNSTYTVFDSTRPLAPSGTR